MHKTAYDCATKFKAKYLPDVSGKSVLDVGSYDVNGTLRPIFEGAQSYTGMDIAMGPGVDVVGNAHSMPFVDAGFDVVVSSSCFEHDEMFWLTFLEMCRVLAPGGFIYICSPSKGHVHRYPVDCWRFYPDSWGALAKWAVKCGYPVQMLESYIAKNSWGDSVGIFRKG